MVSPFAEIAAHRRSFVWRPALTAAGVSFGRENGMHALRHFCASVLLDTHLMPNSEVRTRAAVDRVFRNPESTEDGPETVHGAS